MLLRMAKEIAEYVVEELGDHVKLILVYGSLARGEATEFSDLDMVVVTDGVSYHRSFVLKGRPFDIWSMTLDECEKLITTPSISWGSSHHPIFPKQSIIRGSKHPRSTKAAV